MKHLSITTTQYNYLEKSFAEWLDILGYAETTVKTLPIHARELMHWLEQNNITTITAVKSKHITQFIRELKTRPNLKYGGGLSTSSINKTILALNLFGKYLNTTSKYIIDIHPRRLQAEVESRSILTQQEIKLLYEATFAPTRENSKALGQRDRAILAIFYGCGLRKDEGTRLNIEDIQVEKSLVYVRKGKGNKERFVPIAGKNLEDIQKYIEEGRNWFLENHAACAFYYREGQPRPKKINTDDEAFFLNHKGQRMKSGFYYRLKQLRERAAIEKEFSTHSLRHSIATHLLQAGMEIEEIRKFLGHSTLESTQIYTHIVNELNNQQEEKENETSELMTMNDYE